MNSIFYLQNEDVLWYLEKIVLEKIVNIFMSENYYRSEIVCLIQFSMNLIDAADLHVSCAPMT